MNFFWYTSIYLKISSIRYFFCKISNFDSPGILDYKNMWTTYYQKFIIHFQGSAKYFQSKIHFHFVDKFVVNHIRIKTIYFYYSKIKSHEITLLNLKHHELLKLFLHFIFSVIDSKLLLYLYWIYCSPWWSPWEETWPPLVSWFCKRFNNSEGTSNEIRFKNYYWMISSEIINKRIRILNYTQWDIMFNLCWLQITFTRINLLMLRWNNRMDYRVKIEICYWLRCM